MLKAGDLAGLLAQRVFTTTKAPLLPPGASTTPAPTRFFPKGQIKLDRWAVIGRHLTILTSDWSSAGSPPASTSSSSHKKPLLHLHLLPSPLYLIFILQYPTTINYVPDSAHLFQINWMIAINCHSRSHFYIHNARIVNNCQLNEALWLWSSRAIKVRCLIWECEFKSGIFNRIYLW